MLAIDFVIALLAMIVLVIVSPGLAIVGLVAVIVLIACGVSFLIDRLRARRRARPPVVARRPPSRRPPPRRPSSSRPSSSGPPASGPPSSRPPASRPSSSRPPSSTPPARRPPSRTVRRPPPEG
jgi:hypothetical protein